MSNNLKVTVNGTTVSVTSGTLLSDILDIEKPCGGHGSCGKCKVRVNGQDELACKYVITSDIEVETYQKTEIISETGSNESGVVTDNMCLALDIGTTTLALALVSCDDKKIVKAITATNPQRNFGADVISRIDYCQKNGVSQLNKAIIDAVNSMIEKLLGEYRLHKIEKMFVSGNTTMLHCFFGVDCSSMGVSPYTPAFLGSKEKSAAELGIKSVDSIFSLPGISAFVGADIVAGVGYVGLPSSDSFCLLVDLGTNAEIALFDKKRLLCTSAAAGPCFEGVNISCGMSATDGAVYEYLADKSFKSFGNCPPKGICATGLIDIIAESVKNETIDESGYMEDDLVICDGVTLTPKDVREFQLAKSAVLSAIECLLTRANIYFDNIERLYVAGGFSSALKIENAVFVGLLPKGSEKKFTPINNSSLLGTVKFSCQDSNLSFVENSEFIDISSTSDFSERFFENMYFEVE